MENLRPIASLATGQSASIGRLVGHPDDVHRLEEFGLRPGVLIEMFRPGNPCILRIAGHKICFRADRGLDVLVAASASSSPESSL